MERKQRLELASFKGYNTVTGGRDRREYGRRLGGNGENESQVKKKGSSKDGKVKESRSN